MAIQKIKNLRGQATFTSKRETADRVGYREIRVKLLALESIEPLGGCRVELQEFFTNPALISR